MIAKFICLYQQEKWNVINKDKELADVNHNYVEDKIFFIFGKELEQQLNKVDLIDPSEIKPLSQKEDNEENKSLYEKEYIYYV